MNAPTIHLVFNHFPLVTTIISTLLLAYAVFIDNTSLIKTAFILNIAAFVFTVPLYFSGEGAEEVVEHMGHVSHDYIHEHEEMAEKTFVFSILLALISAAAFFNFPRRFSQWLPKIVLLCSSIAFILFAYTAHLGGRVSHPELRAFDKEKGIKREHE